MKKYVLIEFPESQEYMEMEDVHLCNDTDKYGSSAYFVPEEYLD